MNQIKNKLVILNIGDSTTFSDKNGKIIKISLESIDFPKDNIPGNRPYYNLIFTYGDFSEKLLFDSYNSGNLINCFGFNFQIMNSLENINELKILNKTENK
ncbi:MAG: hypothetical protein PHE25_01510 [Candidatus Gracilibacteria bacterium]|nr:hypothetical protein [Candidatus Gracilibacteria bacterium]